ncbi:MAG: sulfite exporter TauE/SafE family protein [Candidatus Nanopelagicales bacterium]|nr:sulfite exporter TauE/SafE family protein [Candidatus Nanopelagicales bacterium]
MSGGLLVVVLVGAILGLVLGLLGGGGGILAVPLLVALGEPVLVASTMSLVIVGTGAAAAIIPHHRAQRVDWRVGLTFGALGSVGAIVGARAAQSASDALLLGGLAVMLVIGATTMLRAAVKSRRLITSEETDQLVPTSDLDSPDVTDSESTVSQPRGTASTIRMVLLASGVGLITGFFGVGAGFVVVPALIAAMNLPVKRATATGLVVIVMNSAVALAVRHSDLGPLSLTFSLAAATAIFAIIGALVSSRIPGWVLSGAFGILMLLVGGFTVVSAILAG